MPGRRVVFWRISDRDVVGDMRLDGDALDVTGGARAVTEVARGRGESDPAIFQRYVNWSNGVFASREVRSDA